VGPADDAKWEEFAKVVSWRRDDYVKKAGLATFPMPQNPTTVSPKRALVFSRNCWMRADRRSKPTIRFYVCLWHF
jgi:hypothetical protein